LLIYLDNAATTAVDPRVAADMMRCLTEDGTYGNAASISHAYGDAARAKIDAARAQVAAAVGCEADEIIWTSGATEADNLAVFGVAQYYQGRGRHLVTSRTEHKAIIDPCRELERRGWSVTYLSPDARGLVSPQSVAAAIRPDTVLVSIMHINNEIGVIQDIAAIAAVCNARQKPLHVDAAHSAGKVRLDLRSAGIALASLSAHKAYGPKGVGALAINKEHRVQLQPLLFGGGQERGLRSGTLPTHQIVGMGAALQLAEAQRDSDCERIARLRDRLWEALSGAGGCLRNSDPAVCVPHLLNVSFEDVEGESLLAEVRDRIAVSTGSACTSATREPSYVLRALGRDERLAESSLRFGLGRFTTQSDIDAAAAALTQALRRLRRIAC
jgi:cysteine desulfurase